MTDHLSTFLDAVFRNCTSDGGVHLYAFKHDDSRKASENLRVARTDLTTMRAMIDRVARARSPSQVFSPPVCLFGPSPRTVTTNVLEAPVIALELDDHPGESRALAEAVLGPATLVIQSGGVTAEGEDKLHLYWRLTQPARTPDEQATLRAVRMQLIALTGGDSTGGPIVHPMRWPGSWHTKGEPRLCVIAEHTDREISLQEAVDAMALVGDLPNVRPVTPREGWKTPVALTAEELARLASAMPNAGLTWDEWNKTGMAFFDASHGSDDGLAAFHIWSEKDHRYSEEETEARWYHWHNSPPSMLGAGTLYHTAGEVQPRPTWDPEVIFADDEPRTAPPRLEPPARTAARLGGYGVRKHNSMFMGIMEQLAHFSGCVYVIHTDRILMPDGSEVNQSRFDSLMGGHTFAIDDVNEKTTKSAWEAFLKNNAFTPPIVHATCFRPELEPFEIVQDGTWRLVNTYQPIATPRIAGDPEPFLKHMRTLFPDERDRRILLTYMASLVQNPGVKFQWWPVIQGAKGNGKTLLLSIMAYAVGDQYSHLPNTSKMTRNGINFNGWLKGKLFLGMDEVYSSQRRDFLEEFKPYVTNRRLPIESKGVDEYTGDNRANGMMLTNHKDGVPVDKDERRYAVFFTAQQTADDCFRDGLTPAHFHTLWQWMDRDGFAIVNDFLRSYQCEAEFDPAGRASRAPRTSSTDLAIEASRGRAETEILDAIDEGRQGFKGGWVSSRALAKLMEEKRINLPRNKYRETMDGMGYVPHPGLKDGKTGGPVMPDGCRTILYIYKDGPWTQTVNVVEIADQYMKEQMGA